jgi:hypothetical protein
LSLKRAGIRDFGRRFMTSRWRLSLLALGTLFLLALPQAPASAAGGSSIATAPTIVFGQHTFGTTATGEYDCGPGEFWNLALQPGDQATIDWGATQLDYAHGLYVYPAGTTDFSINNVDPLDHYYLGENGKAEAVFSSGTGGNFPLIFAAEGCDEDHHAGPYDFTVTDQHAISVALRQFIHIKPTTTLTATANLASGAPVPDGLSFTLTATWPGGGIASYSAASVGSGLTFPLTLPETAEGQKVTFIVTRAADTQYQAVKSASYEVLVSRPKVAPVQVSPCGKATRRAHAVGRQYARLKSHVRFAHGATGRRLRHQLRRIQRELRVAKTRESGACAGT